MLHFGEHITIDGYGGSYELLNDEQLCLAALSELPELLDMHPLSVPMLISAPDNQIKDPGGWSGFVIMAKSHIAVYTFPKRGFITVSIRNSQSGLNTGATIDYFKSKFQLNRIETNLLKIGLRIPPLSTNSTNS